ncbi:MAG: response regulator [Nitrospirae bacterium YQR-1]
MRVSALYKKTLLIVVLSIAVTASVNFLYEGFWPFLITLVIVSGVAGFLLKKIIDEPLNTIIEYAKKLVDHEYDAKIDINTGDEFDALSSILQFMAIDIVEIFERFEEAAGSLAEKDFKVTATLNYLNAVINNMADGLLVVDSGGIITRINSPLAEFFGITACETTGKSVQDVFGGVMSGLFKQSMIAVSDEVLTTDIELSSSVVLRASSTVIHIKGSGIAEGQPQNINGVVIIVRDVTKERNVDRMKTDFISTVSHELRTPLTSILGFTEIIQERLQEQIFPNLPGDSKKMQKSTKLINDNLNIIIGEGVRLTSLINDVLDIAKMEAGKVEWKKETISINDIIARASLATQSLFTKSGLKFEVNIQPDLPKIIGDADRLVQVVINLISNAVKFTTEGSVTCRAVQTNSEIIISITDTGVGIDEKDKETVFEKFKQVGDTLTDKPKGTGLGLPISKQIITHHQGRIWVESEYGKGSTFSFTLPVQAESSYMLTSTDLETLMKTIRGGTEAGRLEGITTAAPGSKTILVVDDEESIRELLRQELQSTGYSVETAKNGMEAIKSVKERRPHLIILDVMMPEMNGFDVAAVIKGDPATADVPIIILSVVEDSDRGRRLGVDRYLTKPINKEILFDDIKTLLAGGTSKKKILVVDEDESNVKTLADALQTKGYAVVSATDGLESIEKARAEKPDIIIVDAMLSERDQLVKTLRFEKGLENVYFIYLYGQGKRQGM